MRSRFIKIKAIFFSVLIWLTLLPVSGMAANQGDACSSNADCGSGFVCLDKVCPITACPGVKACSYYQTPDVPGTPGTPSIAIPIPGFSGFSKLSCKPGETCDNPWFAEYILAIAKYTLGIIGLIAVVVMMFGGFLWLVGRAEEGKKWIAGAVSGLILAMSFSVILAIIDPDLLNIKSVGIQTINWSQYVSEKANVQTYAESSGSYASYDISKTAYENLSSDVKALVDKYASDNGLDPNYVAVIIMIESGGNQNAVSSAGAVGLMQLMPATADRFGVTDRTDSEQSVMGGTEYLQVLYNMFGDSKYSSLMSGKGLTLDEVVAGAYNCGEGCMQSYLTGKPLKNGMSYNALPSETQGYINKLRQYYTKK